MKFILLINVKITTIYVVVILTFISRIHDKRISVTLGIVRLTFGSPELHSIAPDTVKIQIGQKLDAL